MARKRLVGVFAGLIVLSVLLWSQRLGYWASSWQRKDSTMYFIHPRKCGGTTLIALFEHNTPNRVFVDIEQWKVKPPVGGVVTFTTQQEWDRYQPPSCNRCYITIGRDPVQRVIALYRHRQRRGQIPASLSLGKYLAAPAPVSSPHWRDDQYHGFYSWAQMWCGKQHKCTRFATEGEWILSQAKTNMLEKCALVGTVERFDDFVREGIRLFPAQFGRGDYVRSNSAANRPTAADTAVASSSMPPVLLSIEQRFYDWADSLRHRDYGGGTWKPKKLFWQSPAAAHPWDGKGGKLPAVWNTVQSLTYHVPDLYVRSLKA